jgi:EAL domain-containing protein (putative c-di-GMP-specific phosphodiesterase class I)
MLVNLLDVRQALEKEAVVPCFQPIVELRTGNLAGFEVLARWQHPSLGLILPENFISLAEENGLIGELTHQILSKSFLAASGLPEPLSLAVNVSPIQLQYVSLPRQIYHAAWDYSFPLRRLTVEVTESALVNNLERARKIATELKDMGCELALDDFGTGYSSLTHLQALPFSKLKVDRSFVGSMTEKRGSRKIVAAVVGLGHSLGMMTVAEGVETQEQADILLWLGCELAQGWLYGRPLPAEHLPDMIADSPRKLSTQLSTSRDGTMVSSLEAMPAQRSAQLQAIYDGAPVGLCFLDKNLRYVSINQRLADLNGAPVVAHIGRTVQEMAPKVFPRVQPFLERALQGEIIVNLEVLKPSPKRGEPDLTVHSSYYPAFDEAEWWVQKFPVRGITASIPEAHRLESVDNLGWMDGFRQDFKIMPEFMSRHQHVRSCNISGEQQHLALREKFADFNGRINSRHSFHHNVADEDVYRVYEDVVNCLWAAIYRTGVEPLRFRIKARVSATSRSSSTTRTLIVRVSPEVALILRGSQLPQCCRWNETVFPLLKTLGLVAGAGVEIAVEMNSPRDFSAVLACRRYQRYGSGVHHRRRLPAWAC